MLKLMKYEFRKYALIKIIIAISFVSIELLFLCTASANNLRAANSGMGVLQFIAAITTFIIIFEPIVSLSSDLGRKSGYLLFLTPNSSYRIMWAKTIYGILQVIVAVVIFNGVFLLDVAMMTAKYGAFDGLGNSYEGILNFVILYTTSSELIDATKAMFVMMLIWFSSISLVYLSLCISTAILSRKKGKSIVSFFTFLVLQLLFVSTLSSFGLDLDSAGNGNLLGLLIISSIILVAATFGSAWVLEKKVSL